MKLSPREFDILQILVRHAGKVLTHKFIIREVWKVETDVQYLRIYIKQLRRKIEANPQQPRHTSPRQAWATGSVPRSRRRSEKRS